MGQGIQTRLTGELPGLGPVDESDLWGYDPGADLVHMFSITSFGDVHDHAGRWTDERTLALQWRGVREGQEAIEEISITLPSGGEMHVRSTMTVGGQPAGAFEATFRKR